MANFSVLISGKAGSGKSFLLRNVIEHFKQNAVPYYVTASTLGIAAVNVGGIAIHLFAGIGTSSKGIHELIALIRANKEACGEMVKFLLSMKFRC
jgi:ATP-dependent DNA helicase PIF1